MGNLWFKRVGVLLASAVVLSACGGGGGGGDDSTSTSSLCGGPTLFVGLAYPIGLSATQNTATTWTPTVTDLPASCASSVSYSLATGPLPAGMAVNGSTGAVSGTPTNTGRGFFSVKLTVAGYASSITSSSVPYSVGAPPPPAVAFATKAASIGVGTTATFSDYTIATIGTNLYALVSTNATGTDNYVLSLRKSTDSGATWSQDATPTGVSSLHSYSLVSNGTNLFVIGGRTTPGSVTASASVTYNNAVWKFTPNAVTTSPGTWATTTSSLYPGTGRESVAVSFDGTSKLYAYGGANSSSIFDGVYASTDAGATWATVQGPTAYNLVANCLVANGNTLYSFGGLGFAPGAPAGTPATEKNIVLKSSDSGFTWNVIDSSMVTSPQGGTCAAIGSNLYYVGGFKSDPVLGGGLVTSRVSQSSNGGQTWFTDATSSIFGFRAFHGMTVLANKLVVLGGFAGGGGKTDVIVGTP